MFLLGLSLISLNIPESIWMEAESFGPLRGANFSFMKEDLQTSGSWSIAGPDVAASWTQGGESEFMSVAARADEPAGTAISREALVPRNASYRLWVRYADYRTKAERFVVRTHQAGKTSEFTFGADSIVDEMDQMKLLWDWSYGWDSVSCNLVNGPIRLEIVTTGPTEARRNLDCLCLTTDETYRPSGRQKPLFACWDALEEMRKQGMPDVESLVSARSSEQPKAEKAPSFLWNVSKPWADELRKPLAERVDWPFSVDPPLLPDFLAMFKGGKPAVYSDKNSGPVWHIPSYPEAFATESPALDWLRRHPESRFAILLNYGEPQWPVGADRQATRANLQRFKSQFDGFIAGENIAYAAVDEKGFEAAIRRAKSRQEVLAALKKFNTDAVVAKFSDYFGKPLKPNEAWVDVVSCLSANIEALCHALGAWGVGRIGHENTGNSPTLSRRLAFLRGAARQFECELVDYQSANLGDSATMFSREAYFYPASTRYILDNSYDAWAGAGTTWLMKDYLLWYLAGANTFYNEQGVDIFWKPGGGAAGDDFPVQLSPKGKVAEAVQRVVSAHPRPTQFTPVAFLVDEAHGWSQERFQPGAFALDPEWNPAVLRPGRHEAALRGWFDVAYYPAPLTQSEPATAIRQTFVNGIFGDIFDVIVNSPGRTKALSSYPVIISAGEITLSKEWSDALNVYVQNGGTLVATVDQFAGSPLSLLGKSTKERLEASGYRWLGKSETPTATYQFAKCLGEGRVLATTPEGDPLAVLTKSGKGQVINIGIPLGLGHDDRPVAFLGPLMQHLTQGLTPIRVKGDVEWTVGQLPDGGWVVGLFNNLGVTKPQHGILPVDHSQSVTVKLSANWAVSRSEEWMTGKPVKWSGNQSELTIPAGAVRLVAIYPAP